MWYGGHYHECFRKEQIQFSKTEIQKLEEKLGNIDQITHSELLKLGYNQIQAARILYILRHFDFPDEDESEYD